VLEDDLVVAQITKSILPFLGRSDDLSALALDQFSLILGAHILQRYGVLQKTSRRSKGGLAPWQKRRASELLHENMHGRIRLSEIARECGLSVSHFARSFKAILPLMLANQQSSTPPTTADSSDQVMQDGAGRRWTSLGQAPGLQIAWRRLPAFRSDMERRSAVVSLIVALPVRRANESPNCLLAAEFEHVNRIL